MTDQLFNPQPNYSGVTIQIANPAVNVSPCTNPNSANCTNNATVLQPQNINTYPQGYYTEYQNDSARQVQPQIQGYPYAYPPQYYLNNYNTTNVNGKGINDNPNANTGTGANEVNGINEVATSNINTIPYSGNSNQADTNMTLSNEIIGDINNRIAEEKEQKKNTKEKKIIALTDDYIKSLESYLDNPNDEVRLMASKEVLKRLDEDKDRYDDAALNALLNKMMQDPSKLVRIAALSAFSSQLASGNDYTVKLLKDIQSNPKSDKEDIMQAADALLKMSADITIKRVPIPVQKESEKNQLTK